MTYPSEFPQNSRAEVEAEAIRAYTALEQNVRGTESWQRDVLFIRCVMRVFLAFVRKACEFAKKNNDPAWSDRELDQRCRDFLLSVVIDAWQDTGQGLGISRMFSYRGCGYSLYDDARRKVEDSPEWKQYRDLLLDALDVQAARTADEIGEESALRGGDGPEGRSVDDGTESGLTAPLAGVEKLAWEDIEIRFTSEHHVQIFVRDRPGDSVNFADMGFEDRRGVGGKPNRAWALLVALSQNDGIHPAAKVSGDQSTQKRAQELRDRLGGYFRIAGDPLPFLEGTGYNSSSTPCPRKLRISKGLQL
ncbi:MAG: hypothetical protein LAQ69_30590 [Acidobacteriia bacterium]|nr:hypothetical protein [Terriglobia bacterium]